MTEENTICSPGGRGILLFNALDRDLPSSGHGAICAVSLLYCFLGVSIIADDFMSAIEVITRQRKKVLGADGKWRTKKVWNSTVATLTLMALGSSAPEICLSVIELIKKDFHVGQLGPSTIVGSGAFNLLVIVAVCICAVPSGEVRLIQETPAYYLTVVFSMGGYMWLVCILTMHTVDVVDIGEAVVTLLLMPIFVYAAYCVDTRRCTVPLCLRSYFAGVQSTLNKAREPPVINTSEEAHLKFDHEIVVVQALTAVVLEVAVVRTGDCECPAKCVFYTEPFTAVPGIDYQDTAGSLEFGPHVTTRTIHVDIRPNSRRRSREFLLILEGVEGPVEFDPLDDGGRTSAIQTVRLQDFLEDSVGVEDASLVSDAIASDWLHWAVTDYHASVAEAFYGSPEGLHSGSDVLWHLIAMPWKILFLIVPPTSFLNGWLSFFVSLGVIAVLTALLGDLAELFGCQLGVPDIVTAVSFVAMGTSMPDLFASLTAAKDEMTADASIVNVTGSNAVNVFLGLGLPWTMGSIYWAILGREGSDWAARYPAVAADLPSTDAAFVVDSQNLGFSVLAFLLASMLAVFLLFMRRHFVGAELGGPFWPKVATAVSFVAMWFGFVGTTSWRVLRWTDAGVHESVSVLGVVAGLELLIACWPVALVCKHRRDRELQKRREAEEPVEGLRQDSHHVCSSVAPAGVMEAGRMPAKTMERSESIGSLGTVGTVTSTGSEALALQVKKGASLASSEPRTANSAPLAVGVSHGVACAPGGLEKVKFATGSGRKIGRKIGRQNAASNAALRRSVSSASHASTQHSEPSVDEETPSKSVAIGKKGGPSGANFGAAVRALWNGTH